MNDGLALLYPYQRRWLDDESRFKAGMWSRQTGKTFAATLEIVRDVLAARTRGEASPWLILSRGERQAREAMRAGVRRHALAFGLAGARRAPLREYDLRAGGRAWRAHEWDAGGGNLVTALPANPDTARGYSRNVYLDEFALHRDSREVWAALYPSVTRGWRIRVTSTPRGEHGKFHELMTTAPGWSRHVVTIHDAVADGLPADPEALRRGLGDPALWRREYECETTGGCRATSSRRASTPPRATRRGFADGPASSAVDQAIRRHLWVAWALEIVGDVAWTREVRVLRGGTFAQRDDALAAMVARFRPVRVAADRTGLGEKPVEDWKRRFGATRVEGWRSPPARKLDLATALRERVEQGRLRLAARRRDPPRPAFGSRRGGADGGAASGRGRERRRPRRPILGGGAGLRGGGGGAPRRGGGRERRKRRRRARRLRPARPPLTARTRGRESDAGDTHALVRRARAARSGRVRGGGARRGGLAAARRRSARRRVRPGADAAPCAAAVGAQTCSRAA